jgi:acetolactate synthase-1/3 small subunit
MEGKYMTEQKRHIISALVYNKPGVLARISTLFAARGYNIDSLAVGETDNPEISRMTIVVRGDEKILEQVEKQLNKLIDVIKVYEFSKIDHVERDLVLIKVNATNKTRAEIIEIAEIFRAKIVDVSHQTLVLEITGDEDKISAFINLLKPYGIKELVRTGVIAMARG